jgi:hypothetical protein
MSDTRGYVGAEPSNPINARFLGANHASAARAMEAAVDNEM